MSYTFVIKKGKLSQQELDDIASNLSGSSLFSGSFTIVWNEPPSGIVDGSNKIFNLVFPPNPSDSLMLFMNGQLQQQGTKKQFLLSGTQITFNDIPPSGSNLISSYQRLV